MRIGILGGGQLARLLATAAYNLGLDISLLCEAEARATQSICPDRRIAAYEDNATVREFLRHCHAITFESENIPHSLQTVLAEQPHIQPGLKALQTAQDRLQEKTCFKRLGIATNDFCVVDEFKQLEQAAQQLGFPFVLKQRSLGYDGKGQYVIKSADDLEAFREQKFQHFLAEAFVDFEREISIVGVRDQHGRTLFYDVGDNTHVNGILFKTLVRQHDPLQNAAETMLCKLLDDFDYVGVLALECFVANGQLLANEIAPRVHNSGHWTMHGALTCQFENHIRAVAGLPLGSTRCLGEVAMFNVIGHRPTMTDVLALDDTFYADYQKEARAGRKLGHVNVVSADHDNFVQSCNALETLVLANNR